jgi:hypothetical protein
MVSSVPATPTNQPTHCCIRLRRFSTTSLMCR